MSMRHASGDPQPQQSEQAGDGVINRPRRRGLGHEGAELHAVEPERRGLRVDLGPADVLGRRLGHEAVDDGEAVESDHC